MGQKTHPYGFRLGYNKPWKSRWYAERDYADLLHEDVKLRTELKEKLKSAGISSIDIERAANKLVVRIYTARPGIIIGRKGAEIDKLKQEVQKRTKREVHIDIQEVHRPELDAATGRRIDCAATRKARGFSPRDAQSGGLGAALRLQRHQGSRGRPLERRGNRPQRMVSAGPLAAANASRGYRFRHGAKRNTTYGVIGVKCWIYQGENVPKRASKIQKERETTGRSVNAAAKKADTEEARTQRC